VGVLQSLPEPELQGVGADEARIGRQDQMLLFAVPGFLPVLLPRLDEHQACWRARPELVVRDRVGGQTDDLREGALLERHRLW
jgi:hypothetical protein